MQFAAPGALLQGRLFVFHADDLRKGHQFAMAFIPTVKELHEHLTRRRVDGDNAAMPEPRRVGWLLPGGKPVRNGGALV